jgi:hypothetical protein
MTTLDYTYVVTTLIWVGLFIGCFVVGGWEK